ncbi:N-acetylglucosamine-6-phosphate deacetylase [Chungangia koreensis]|uniref:N-acetylglucosamine-6-phosphate deacetylase n=1 Tax=Chungangia koreensis TaxID=752657 RepID=A0ABV8X2H0_9LACT
MEHFIIENVSVCLEDGRMIQGEILISNGRIIEVIEGKSGIECERFNGNGNTLLPGFIDIHIHGADGADFMDGSVEAAAKIAKYLPSEGTTSFLATTITQSPEAIHQAIYVNREYIKGPMEGSAEMLGFHLEGPFIHPEQAGAQPKEFIVEPSLELLMNWFGESLTDLKIVTLAPERDSGLSVTSKLHESGVILSAGHTKATFSQMLESGDKGITHLTHFTNAMTGIHHREIGVVGAGFMDERFTCEVIADGIHISVEMLKMMSKFIGMDRLILITDSMRAKGLPDGVYSLGGQPVTVADGKAVLADGTLAGSVLKMNDGVKLMKEVAGLTWHQLQLISSQNAAKRLGLYSRKGSISRGKDADLVLVTEDLEVLCTFCKGAIGYINEKLTYGQEGNPNG